MKTHLFALDLSLAGTPARLLAPFFGLAIALFWLATSLAPAVLFRGFSLAPVSVTRTAGKSPLDTGLAPDAQPTDGPRVQSLTLGSRELATGAPAGSLGGAMLHSVIRRNYPARAEAPLHPKIPGSFPW